MFIKLFKCQLCVHVMRISCDKVTDILFSSTLSCYVASKGIFFRMYAYMQLVCTCIFTFFCKKIKCQRYHLASLITCFMFFFDFSASSLQANRCCFDKSHFLLTVLSLSDYWCQVIFELLKYLRCY